MKKPGKVITIFVVLIILVIVAVLVAFYGIKSNKEKGEETTTVVSQNEENEEVTTSSNSQNEENEEVITSSSSQSEEKNIEYSTNIKIVPTLLDEISTNSAWCATFQLVWNDMQDEIVGQDIVFNPQLSIIENLNQQSFTEDDISEEYYYKNYGLFTLDLKKEIEEGIKEKFDEPSDILSSFDWDSAPQSDSGYDNSEKKKYLLYTMLYREFNFDTKFDILQEGMFKGTEKTYPNIEYFGIDSASSLKNQVDVLYYISEEDCAVILNTKEGDQVVLCKGCTGNTYQDIWNEVQAKSLGTISSFTDDDRLKVPMMKIDIKKEYTELENDENGSDTSKIFYDKKSNTCYITQAVQTIKFELDESGGKVISEVGIDMYRTNSIDNEWTEHNYRYFYFNSTFTMFLVEEGKDLPYYAMNVDDITLFQD